MIFRPERRDFVQIDTYTCIQMQVNPEVEGLTGYSWRFDCVRTENMSSLRSAR
jgi:hypothetical protein